MLKEKHVSLVKLSFLKKGLMKRANIIAKGKVQKVGYRDFVQDSARELGIAGFVENLEDGNVKIVCEGEEH